MAKRSSLRASDADRDRVADRLREAAGEGRLLAHELEDRLATALRARTYGELDAVVEDLPGGPTAAIARKRSGGLRLAVDHPLAAVMLFSIVAIAVLATVAMVVFSGLWLIPLLVFAAVGANGGRGGRRRHRHRRGHAHRYGRP